MKRYPFSSFPRGWFKIAFSDELALSETLVRTYLGQEITCRRFADGHVTATDKEQREFPSQEINGIIFVYYDPEGLPPRFPLPEIPEFGSSSYSGYHKLVWRVRGHVEEIAENAVDYSHFVELHTYKDLPRVEAFEIDRHNFRVVLASQRKCVGGLVSTHTDIKYHGLGLVVSPVNAGAWNIVAVLTPTPIDDEFIEINLSILYRKSKNPFKNLIFSLLVMRDIAREFERDIPIWENKIYHTKPLLCRGDGPIMKLRQWAKQFYSEPHVYSHEL